jgi:tetratricopeptide (TPR) repeat protein
MYFSLEVFMRAKRLWIVLLAMGWLVLTISSAEAGWFWGRRRGAGNATGTEGGGAVRQGRLLGGNDARLPYVIMPRHTWVPPGALRIQWHPVAGANQYTVRLWQWSFAREAPGFMVWQTTVDGTVTETQYPGTYPLSQGLYYSIEVVTDTGISSNADLGFAESGFEVLFPVDETILREQLALLNLANETENDSPDQIGLATARIYADQGILSEAIAILVPLRDRYAQNAEIYQALGDLYSAVGLTQLAIDHYQAGLAVILSRGQITREDQIAQALALSDLAEMNALAGDWRESRRLFSMAQSVYSLLGLEDAVAYLQRRIDTLEALL